LNNQWAKKTETEFYRRLVDKLYDDGTGHNMGALYWQLNDIWQGCSWASLEFTGRWKMFAYYIRRSLAPILPSPYVDADGNVIIELISDMREDFAGDMRVRVLKTDSLTPLIDRNISVSAEYLTSQEVHRITATELEDSGCSETPIDEFACFVYLTLPNAPDNFLWLHYPKSKNSIKAPNVRALQYSASPDLKTFTLTLGTNEVAPFVFINLKNSNHGKFDDNGFIMVESQKTIVYTSRDPIPLAEFIAQLDIISLYDVTQFAP